MDYDKYEVYLGEKKNDFSNDSEKVCKDIYSKTFRMYDNDQNQNPWLVKIYKKKFINNQNNKDYLLKQIYNEIEILSICDCDNIIKLREHFETENSIVLVLENCETSLYEYIRNEGPMKYNKKSFKKLVRGISNGLIYLKEKSILHRGINTKNIFLQKKGKNYIPKIANFLTAIDKNKNDNKKFDTTIYMSPEMMNGNSYDEKNDLWSLGIIMYDIYNGFPPYGFTINYNYIKNKLSNEEEFYFTSSNNKSLDVLFKMLLTKDIKKRISHEELKSYIDSDFTNPENKLINEENYQKIYNNIIANKEKTDKIDNGERVEILLSREENDKQFVEKLFTISSETNVFDYMNYLNYYGNIEEKKINNIIYYDEHTEKNAKGNNLDTEIFEQETNCAFFKCYNEDSFDSLMVEIKQIYEDDNRILFNLIIHNDYRDKIENIIKNKSYEKYIKNTFIFNKQISLANPIEGINKGIYQTDEVLDFINDTSFPYIKPFNNVKLITYKNSKKYLEKYKKYYHDYNEEEYKKLFERKVRHDIYMRNILEPIRTLDICNRDLCILNEFLNSDYIDGGYKNWFLFKLKEPMRETMQYYFTARLKYVLREFAKENKLFYNSQNILFKGMKLNYSTILPYFTAKGKTILIRSFMSASEEKDIASTYAGKKEEITKLTGIFSVIFNISNCDKIKNAVNIQAKSNCELGEKILILPFYFYKVKDVNINYKDRTANIHLEAINEWDVETPTGGEINGEKKI